jgi:mannose-6-phosphate isomerase-like protein (cupin superfamily)
MVNTTDKPWGKSRRVHIDRFVQVEEVDILPGGFSSVHHHNKKDNVFYVASGELLVSVFHDDLTEANRIIMKPGDWMVVPAGQKHQFRAVSDVKAYEVYWLDDPLKKGRIEPEDIDRSTQNGLDELPAMVDAVRIRNLHCCICNKTIEMTTASKTVVVNNAERDVCGPCHLLLQENK